MNIFKRFKDLSPSARAGIRLSLLAIPSWLLAIAVIHFLAWVFQQDSSINLKHYTLVPLIIIILGVFFNFIQLYKILRIHPRYFTLFFTALHGIWAQYLGLQIHESYNGYFILFLFSFGLLFLKSSIDFTATIVFSLLNVLLSIGLIYWLGISIGVDEKLFLFFFGFQGLTSALFNKLNLRRDQALKSEQKKRRHNLKQLEKVFFPHQLEMIDKGLDLEKTMPVGQGRACVLDFDVIASSKVEHENAKLLFRETFGECSVLMMEGYSPHDMTANAYRVNEMGDGFLCAIGYPFKPPANQSNAETAVRLALRFISIFMENVKKLDYEDEIYCAIGIASGEIDCFYTKHSPVEYHCYGSGIILATRYEQFRRILAKYIPIDGSIIILQRQVYKSLPSSLRRDFKKFDLAAQSIHVRDDPAATSVYYRIIHHNSIQETVTELAS